MSIELKRRLSAWLAEANKLQKQPLVMGTDSSLVEAKMQSKARAKALLQARMKRLHFRIRTRVSTDKL